MILHAAAFILLQVVQAELQVVAPAQEIASAQAITLRLKLLKVAARVRETSRAVRVHLCSSYPMQSLWMALALRLQRLSP